MRNALKLLIVVEGVEILFEGWDWSISNSNIMINDTK